MSGREASKQRSTFRRKPNPSRRFIEGSTQQSERNDEKIRRKDKETRSRGKSLTRNVFPVNETSSYNCKHHENGV